MPSNIFSEILVFGQSLDPWQNEALRRLFASGHLSLNDKEEIFKIARIHYGLEKAPPEMPNLMLTKADLPIPPSLGQKVQLQGVRQLINVNALKSDQRLSIGKKLTVIYGDNGSGKSGYARVMKKAFRARAIDPILPNVHATTLLSEPASAIFEIEENGTVNDLKWVDGTKTADVFGRFAVFDSKCARVYITENNQLSYLPYGFDIIEGLATITTEIKRNFQEFSQSASPKPDSLKHLIDNSSIGKLVGSMTANTDAEDIKSKATWSDEDEQLLINKKKGLQKITTDSPQSIRDGLSVEKKRLLRIQAVIDGVSRAISKDKVEEIKRKSDELKKFEKAVVASALTAFGDLDLPGIGSNVWRELILAAVAYSTKEAYPAQSFPPQVDRARCVLCLQTLDEQARNRLQRFWNFIQDEMTNKRDQAKAALDEEKEALARIPRTLPNEIVVLEDTLRVSGSMLFDASKAFFIKVADRIGKIEEAITSNVWDKISDEPQSPVETCKNEIAAIDERSSKIVDDGNITNLIKSLSSEVEEIEAKKRLKDNLTTVLGYLDALKLSTAANSAACKISTNAISYKTKELQKQFVTEEFKKGVHKHLDKIGLDMAKAVIDEKSEKGKVLHKLTVEDAPELSPEAVFSEGERTAISIACFLAELTTSADNCGIILDDPVSSLDHRIRSDVVDLLVSEATVRQVIVLTHDLIFYRELWGAATRQKVDVKFQNIDRLGSSIGLVSENPPWKTLPVSERIGKLEGILKEVKLQEEGGNVEVYKTTVGGKFYPNLRSTWERAVEELLFNKVVQRLERNVATQSLDGVIVDTESVEAVFDGMARCSSVIDAHDHAWAQDSALPTPSELLNDLNALKDFVTKQKAKRVGIEKEREYLKKLKK